VGNAELVPQHLQDSSKVASRRESLPPPSAHRGREVRVEALANSPPCADLVDGRVETFSAKVASAA